MNSNQKRLRALYETKDPRLLAAVANSTIRRHIEKGCPRDAWTLALYARLGMPVEGWLSSKQRRTLDKIAPLPSFAVADPLGVES